MVMTTKTIPAIVALVVCIGSAGVAQVHAQTRMLAGHDVKGVRPTGPKAVRAAPAARQVGAGNVRFLVGTWLSVFMDELRAFPGTGTAHDDQVDAFAMAFNQLAAAGIPSARVGGTIKQARAGRRRPVRRL